MSCVKIPVHFHHKGQWRDAIVWNAGPKHVFVQFMSDSTATTLTVPRTSTNIRDFNRQEYNTRSPLYVEIAKCDDIVSYNKCVMQFEMMSTQTCDEFIWYCGGKVISKKKILHLQVESTVPNKLELFCLIHNSDGFELVECIFVDSMLCSLESSQQSSVRI